MSLTVIKKDHFAGGKNMSAGQEKGREQHLAELILALQGKSNTVEAAGQVLQFTSAAGAGGAATEAMTLTGLKATDTIIAVSQKTNNANDLPLLGWTTQAADALTGVWSADPGAGAVIQVAVLRAYA